MKVAPFFSIVMPVYNVESYILKTVDCIRKQSFSNWELIIVDDYSPDNCGDIAEWLKLKDERITVIHHEINRGVSQARNTGEGMATGKYIWFVDPDDYVELNLLEIVYNSLIKNEAEIVVFGLIEEYFGKKEQIEYKNEVVPEKHFFSTPKELRKYIIKLEQETLYGYVWNKVYRLEYLRNLKLKYEDVKLIEDILFNVKFCRDIKSMNTLDVALYHYAKRSTNSLTNKYVADYFKLHKKRIESIFEQYEYWNMCTLEVKSILGSLYARYILSAIQRNCCKEAKMNHSGRYKWCRTLFCDSLFNELVCVAKSKESRTLAIWLFVLKTKNAGLCLVIGRIVFIIKRKIPLLYSKVKSGR